MTERMQGNPVTTQPIDWDNMENTIQRDDCSSPEIDIGVCADDIQTALRSKREEIAEAIGSGLVYPVESLTPYPDSKLRVADEILRILGADE